MDLDTVLSSEFFAAAAPWALGIGVFVALWGVFGSLSTTFFRGPGVLPENSKRPSLMWPLIKIGLGISFIAVGGLALDLDPS